MKKALLLIGITSLFLGSCKKDAQLAGTTNHEVETNFTTQSQSTDCFSEAIENIFDDGGSIGDSEITLVGELHNQYLAYYLQYAINDGIQFSGTNFDSHFRSTAQTFFDSIGVVLDEEFYTCPATQEYSEDYDDIVEYLSASANDVFDSVFALYETYEEGLTPEAAFVSDLEALYSHVGTLTTNGTISSDEGIALKLMIRVGVKSFDYWDNNLSAWESHFSQNSGSSIGIMSQLSKTQKLKRIGLSDAVGAIRGAISGFMFAGPAGACAFALVDAGWNSAIRGIIVGAAGV